MGSAVAKEDEGQKNKTIFIKLLNHVQWLTFSTKISTEDLNDRLTALCGQPRGATILLKDRYGAQVVVSPAMRTNTLHDAFIVEMQADRLSVSALRKRAKQGRQGMRTGKKVPDT
ncbi:uncharacterized protein LOC123505567 [Portunus trituberculatus]|uniref:uncharacterized protein LOC123505567 n=1 Tax=Portunus trituberculatus TaxID=210409 RepID=UPI001E1D0B0F|nr:uncharacterized protein LOC123505567 [Portunus trituberculatus]